MKVFRKVALPAALIGSLLVASEASAQEDTKEMLFKGKAQVTNLFGDEKDEKYYHTIGGEKSSERKGAFGLFNSGAASDWFTGLMESGSSQNFFRDESDYGDPADPDDDMFVTTTSKTVDRRKSSGLRLSTPELWDGFRVHAGYWKETDATRTSSVSEISIPSISFTDTRRITNKRDLDKTSFDLGLSKRFTLGELQHLDAMVGASFGKLRRKTFFQEYLDSVGVVSEASTNEDANALEFYAGAILDFSKDTYLLLQSSMERLDFDTDPRTIRESLVALQFKALGLYITPSGRFGTDLAGGGLRFTYMPNENGEVLRNYAWQSAKNSRIVEGLRNFADEVNELQRDYDAGTFFYIEPSAVSYKDIAGNDTLEVGASAAYSQVISDNVRAKIELFYGTRETDISTEFAEDNLKDKVYRLKTQLDLGGVVLEGAFDTVDGDSGKRANYSFGVTAKF